MGVIRSPPKGFEETAKKWILLSDEDKVLYIAFIKHIVFEESGNVLPD